MESVLSAFRKIKADRIFFTFTS